MLRESIAMLHYAESVVTEVFILTAEFSQENGQWTGECLELGTATCADTLEDVRKELYELIALHVNEVNRLGFAKEFFGEHGVQPLPVAGVSEETAQNSFVAVGAPL